jgi:dipeptidyl aminopeptidase/acylaminoacyl peptidase
MKNIVRAALLAASALPAAAFAQSAEAVKFGARETVRQVSISPDGKRIAMLVTSGPRGAGLVVVDTADGKIKPLLNYPGDEAKLANCNWSSSERLVCTLWNIVSQSGKMIPISRMIAINADGSKVKELSARQRTGQLYERFYGGGILDWLPDGDGSAVLMLRHFVPEASTGTLVTQKQAGLGVERVDTLSLKRSVVEQPRETGGDFLTDGHGTVRVMGVRPRLGTGYLGNEIFYKYRRAESTEWEDLSKVQLEGYKYTGFIPYAVDRDLSVAYGFDRHEGRQALFKVALDGSLKRELVLAHPQVDVDDLVRIGRQQRVIGVSYATDRRQISYFDPQIRSVATALAKALPGLPIVGMTDTSLDEKKLVIFAGSDVDPGRYYLLDRTTKQMTEVSPVRPDLEGIKLAPVKAITYKAADGAEVPAYLTLPNGGQGKKVPAIVMPHGGPTARDEWGFDWLSQFFAARGYAVIQPNYRGSAGYGDNWFRDNGFRSWKVAMSDVNDAGRYLVSQGITTPDKLAIVGWSYGGYAALQSNVLDPNLFKAAVAIAPVTDLGELRDEMKFDSSDQEVKDLIGDGPLWDAASPARNAQLFKAPVLLFHGERDRNVAIAQSRIMASKLKGAGKQVELIEYKDLDHQLDDGTVRAGMLDRIDGFLRTSLAVTP